MKHIRIVLFVGLGSLGTTFAAPPDKTFRGEIMDTQCAKMGSHDVMKSKEGARDAAECTRDCVKMGGKYVLYDASAKTIYQLGDQKKLEPFAGQKVDVTGSYDESAHMIHIDDIERITSPSLSTRK